MTDIHQQLTKMRQEDFKRARVAFSFASIRWSGVQHLLDNAPKAIAISHRIPPPFNLQMD
jgi:hypothetical protein